MKAKKRVGLVGFALIAIITAVAASYLLKKVDAYTGPLVSKDCKAWVPSKNFTDRSSGQIFFKDGIRLSQVRDGAQTNLTLTLESPASTFAKEFSFATLQTDYLLVMTSRSFGRLDLAGQTTSKGSAGLNEAVIRFEREKNEGAWNVVFEDADKPVLTANVKALGHITCKVDHCFFSVKENVQQLPLENQKEVLAALNRDHYFDDRLTTIREACKDLNDPEVRSMFGLVTAEIQSQCSLDDVSSVVQLSNFTLLCETLSKTTFPALEKLRTL